MGAILRSETGAGLPAADGLWEAESILKACAALLDGAAQLESRQSNTAGSAGMLEAPTLVPQLRDLHAEAAQWRQRLDRPQVISARSQMSINSHSNEVEAGEQADSARNACSSALVGLARDFP